MSSTMWLSPKFQFFCMVFAYSFIIVVANKINKTPFLHVVLDCKSAVDNIHNFIKSQNNGVNTEKNSKHYWNEEINETIKSDILQINDELLHRLGSEYKYIPSMTELYYSSKANQNSDRQYVDNHMDGPFYGCQLYRAIIAINGNKNIDTYFPDGNIQINLKKYDAVLFDYNNELHYIDVNTETVDNSQRILLKLHYVKSKNNICEKAHCEFGRQTRDLFELNKSELHMSGRIARMSLYYNTYRKYILILVFLLLCFYLFLKNKTLHTFATVILSLFSIIEISGILYTLHFQFLDRNVCK